MLQKISLMIGFTQTEIKVLLFLFVMFFVGFAYSLFIAEEKVELKVVDYSVQDSLFSDIIVADKKAKTISEKENREQNQKIKTTDKISANEKININKANANDLMRLPGIGMRTAENIINRRKEIGRFTSLNQLLTVKGIGETRLENIKKFIEL